MFIEQPRMNDDFKQIELEVSHSYFNDTFLSEVDYENPLVINDGFYKKVLENQEPINNNIIMINKKVNNLNRTITDLTRQMDDIKLYLKTICNYLLKN
jgi:hypothetical protein